MATINENIVKMGEVTNKNENKGRPCSVLPEIDDVNKKRFWDGVDFKMSDKSVCWNWKRSTCTSRYGSFSLKGKNYRSHRYAYFISNGYCPPEMHVMHSCDNRLCCNPLHLKLGTNYDNILDKMAKGRQGRVKKENHWSISKPESIIKGEQQSLSKLTDNKVLEIREFYKSGTLNTYQLAQVYNVTQACIFYVINRKTWKHI
jgi:hypothetical protein